MTSAPTEKQEILNVVDELFLSRVVLQDDDLDKITQDSSSIDDCCDDEHDNSTGCSPLSLPPSLGDPYTEISFNPYKYETFTAERSPLPNKLEDSTNNFLEVEITKLRMQLSSLSNAKRHSDIALERERKRFAQTIRGMQQRSKADMNAIRSKQAFIEAEIPILKEQLYTQKEQFRNLTISDSKFQQLKQQPEENLSLKEYIQLNLHKIISQYRQELEQLKKLEEDKGNDKYFVKLLEAKKSLEEEKENLLKQVEATSTSLINMTQSRDALKNQVKDFECQSEIFRNQNRDLQRQIDIVRADKEYLTKEQTQLSLEGIKKDKEIGNLKERIQELQASYDQLVNVRESVKLDYEKQLSNEIKKLQEINYKELESIRTSGHEVFERENRILRAARDETIMELDRVRCRILELQRSYDDLLLRHSKEQSVYEQQLSDLRSDLKMKTFEFNQIGMIYEEKMSELRQTKGEADMMKLKIETLRGEFMQLETHYLQHIAEVEMALKNESEKVKSYEELEIELDNAVFTMGNNSIDQEKALETIPTRSHRRLQHCRSLAQSLLRSEKKVERLELQLKESENQKQEINRKWIEAKNRLETFSQPKDYLIERIRKEEEKANDLKNQLERMNEQLEIYKKECQEANTLKQNIQKELQNVLTKRKDIDTLREALNDLKHRQKLNQVQNRKREEEHEEQTLKLLQHEEEKRKLLAEQLRSPEYTIPEQHAINRIESKQQNLPKWYFQLQKA